MKFKPTVIEKVTVLKWIIWTVIVGILALLLLGCAQVRETKEIKRWEVKCFTETGITIVVDTLEGGRLFHRDGSIIHKPVDIEWHNSNGVYTGNCRAKMLGKTLTETVY